MGIVEAGLFIGCMLFLSYNQQHHYTTGWNGHVLRWSVIRNRSNQNYNVITIRMSLGGFRMSWCKNKASNSYLVSIHAAVSSNCLRRQQPACDHALLHYRWHRLQAWLQPIRLTFACLLVGYMGLKCSWSCAFYHGLYEKLTPIPDLWISFQFSATRHSSIYPFYHRHSFVSAKCHANIKYHI